jgi:hypothetical protein
MCDADSYDTALISPPGRCALQSPSRPAGRVGLTQQKEKPVEEDSVRGPADRRPDFGGTGHGERALQRAHAGRPVHGEQGAQAGRSVRGALAGRPVQGTTLVGPSTVSELVKTVVTDVQNDLRGIQTDTEEGDSASAIDQQVQGDIRGIITAVPRGF